MLHRQYAASSSGSLDLLDNDAGSIHSLEEDEGKLDFIQGSPFHCDLVPVERPKKRPPKRNCKNETYLSPQPWSLEPKQRTFRDDLMDTSPAPSPGRNNTLNISHRMAARAGNLDLSSESDGASGPSGDSGRFSPAISTGSLQNNVLPQLTVTAPTTGQRCKRNSRSEPADGPPPPDRFDTAMFRQRRGTLPPSAVVPTVSSPSANGPSAATKISNSSPQLRKAASDQPILPPAGRRRGSTNGTTPSTDQPSSTNGIRPGPTPRAAAPATTQDTQGTKPPRPTPPTTRRSSEVTAAAAAPAPVPPAGGRRTSQNGRPTGPAAAATTKVATPQPQPQSQSQQPANGRKASSTDDDSKLTCAVQRFNDKLGSKPAVRPVRQATAQPTAPPQQEPLLTVPGGQPARPHTPTLSPATALASEDFLFEGDLAGTMNAPYYGVADFSAEKKPPPRSSNTVLDQTRSPTLAEMLGGTQPTPTATTSKPQQTKAAASKQQQQQQPPQPSKRPEDTAPIDATAAQRWAAPPAQMTVNPANARRNSRRTSQTTAPKTGTPSTSMNGTVAQAAASQAATDATLAKETPAAKQQPSAQPTSVALPPFSEHKPCEKARNAKRLPPPAATTRKTAPAATASAASAAPTAGGVVAPRQYRQRQLPQRTRGQSIPSADPNDQRLVTMDDICRDALAEGIGELEFDFGN